MADRPPMGARKLAVVGCAVLTASTLSIGAGVALAQNAESSTPAPAAQTDQPRPSDSSSNSSSTEIVHRKLGSNSGQTIRHTRIAEGDAEDPELTQAEEAIQKQNYTAAEPLLRKVVERDPANYVAWFDLGFVENGL